MQNIEINLNNLLVAVTEALSVSPHSRCYGEIFLRPYEGGGTYIVALRDGSNALVIYDKDLELSCKDDFSLTFNKDHLRLLKGQRKVGAHLRSSKEAPAPLEHLALDNGTTQSTLTCQYDGHAGALLDSFWRLVRSTLADVASQGGCGIFSHKTLDVVCRVFKNLGITPTGPIRCLRTTSPSIVLAFSLSAPHVLVVAAPPRTSPSEQEALPIMASHF